MKKLKPSFLPAAGWLIISTILLTLPGSSFPKDDWLSRIWFDKWVHIIMFLAMVVLWCWACHLFYESPKKTKSIFLLIAILCLGYGIVMEFVQLWCVKNRSFDTGDIVADAVGSGVGYLISTGRYIKK